jgi:hypothetical protein
MDSGQKRKAPTTRMRLMKATKTLNELRRVSKDMELRTELGLIWQESFDLPKITFARLKHNLGGYGKICIRSAYHPQNSPVFFQETYIIDARVGDS